MNPVTQTATLEQAIMQIEAMRNSEIYTLLLARPKGTETKPSEITKLADFDAHELRSTAVQAFEHYGASDIFLQVKVPNGSRNKIDRTYLLQSNSPITTMGTLTPYQSNSQPPQRQQGNQPQLSFPPEAAPFILHMKDEQLFDARELVRELRDQQRSDLDTIKKLTEENNSLKLDVKMREREFELEKREIGANQPKGLSGIMETVNGLPPEVTMALINRFLGPAPAAAPQLPMGSVPVMAAGLTANQQSVITELNKELAQMDEEMLTKLYGVLIYIKQGQINLDQILMSVQNAA